MNLDYGRYDREELRIGEGSNEGLLPKEIQGQGVDYSGDPVRGVGPTPSLRAYKEGVDLCIVERLGDERRETNYRGDVSDELSPKATAFAGRDMGCPSELGLGSKIGLLTELGDVGLHLREIIKSPSEREVVDSGEEKRGHLRQFLETFVLPRSQDGIQCEEASKSSMERKARHNGR